MTRSQRFERDPDAVTESPVHHAVVLGKLAGVAERWLVPAGLWHAPRGFDSTERPDEYPHHMIAFRLSGVEVQRVNVRRAVLDRTATRDAVCIQTSANEHRFLANGEVRFGHLYLTNGFVSEVATELVGGAKAEGHDLLAAAIKRDPELRALVDDYVARAFCEEVPLGLEMDARATLIAVHLVKHHSTVATARIDARRGGLTPFQLAQVRDAIEAALGREWPLAELASLVGLSTHHFCRAFKRSTGVPPHRWVIGRRVERAKELLESSPLSITEIAASVGYDDPTQLARVFVKATGTTPTRWRRDHGRVSRIQSRAQRRAPGG